MQIWKNNSPNSSFDVRPVLLLAQKECYENVKFIMTNFINPEASVIEQEGIQFPKGVVRVKVIRSMLMEDVWYSRSWWCSVSVGKYYTLIP